MIEAGGGAQSWINNGGTHGVLSGNLVWRSHSKIFGLVDRIFAGYSRYLINGGADEIRAGVGVSF